MVVCYLICMMMFRRGIMKKQYKGGLHIHTKVSDGAKTPEETLKEYRAAGYDFVALTDHWKQNAESEYEGMKVFSGIECDVGDNTADGVYHIIGVGLKCPIGITKNDAYRLEGSVKRTQLCIDAINAAGGAAILAHPAWSLNRPEDIIKLHGLAGAEIYNAVSDIVPYNSSRADSASILDILASAGCRFALHAADDTHFWKGEARSSFVYTSDSDYFSAIKNGDLYASRGPRLEVTRDGNKLHLECTPVNTITAQTGAVWISGRCICGEDLTEREYTVTERDIWARFEITDSAGNKAWSGYYGVQ